MTGRGSSRGVPGPQPSEIQPRTGAGRGFPQQTPIPSAVQPQPIPIVAPRIPGESEGRGRPLVIAQQPPPQQLQHPDTTRGGNGAPNVDRGSVRSRTILTDIIKKPVILLTKHLLLLKQPTWQLSQYRVDFSPQIELRGLRNRLIFEQKATLGGYLFDGTMLFLVVKLPNDVTEFITKDRDGQPIQTKIKYIWQIYYL